MIDACAVKATAKSAAAAVKITRACAGPSETFAHTRTLAVLYCYAAGLALVLRYEWGRGQPYLAMINLCYFVWCSLWWSCGRFKNS